MRPKLAFACVVLVAAITCATKFGAADETSGHAEGIMFQPAKDTRLGEILTHRRTTLEKRNGGPLKGHQWWRWGRGSF